MGDQQKISMYVGAFVTQVAAVHYFHLRKLWVQIGTPATGYHYIVWTTTVPNLFAFVIIALAILRRASEVLT